MKRESEEKKQKSERKEELVEVTIEK